MSLLRSAQQEFLSHRYTVVYDPKSPQERTFPHRYLQSISNLIQKHDLHTVVEIGSIRLAHHPDQDERHPVKEDGQALWYWAETGANVISIDIDPICLQMWEWTKGHNGKSYDNVTQQIMDGLLFLKNYQGPAIDVLYLDGWDVGSHQYQERHLDAYELAKPHLAADCIIAIDDDDFVKTSKGQLVYPMLINDGFVNVAKGRVSVWVRDSIFAVSA
jgi:hypothetical protein